MLKDIVSPLLKWYDEHHRDLPWRETKDPYRVWVSEIMLQQTRVEAVRPYYRRFLEQLPDIEALAVCPDDRLLKLWEGLGYYSRVKNMKKAAGEILSSYGGVFPGNFDDIKSLSGIGSYTAGAIASIAFEKPCPAVDGNVLRIWARLTGNDLDVLKESTKKKAEEELSPLMPEKRSGDLNQAFMDLGATVCLPKQEAKCENCPLKEYCEAYKTGKTDVLPVRIKKTKRKVQERTILIIRDGEKIALNKRAEKGLLAGLYEFPGLDGFADQDVVLAYLRDKNLDPLYIERISDARHIFSHVEWRMRGYLVRVAALEEDKTNDLIFADCKTAEREYPLPSAFAAYAKYIDIKLGVHE